MAAAILRIQENLNNQFSSSVAVLLYYPSLSALLRCFRVKLQYFRVGGGRLSRFSSTTGQVSTSSAVATYTRFCSEQNWMFYHNPDDIPAIAYAA
ncbi:hypothetical protein M378DRAFT_167101 [Amanita muscaria Koide BX008]|uniref:Uncharacterized protein n=1 Tax=Amanita muscaria (strain Koide BX008) TaxID=946122 RepID=A0A0C2T438_AMAMK|nr:hypothetical protein M378DRAFT_167101 [Amanita muscaria Koide BX008]